MPQPPQQQQQQPPPPQYQQQEQQSSIPYPTFTNYSQGQYPTAPTHEPSMPVQPQPVAVEESLIDL